VTRISDLPKDDCPREKALKFGLNSLTNSELIAIIIGYGIKNINAIEVSQNLLKSMYTLTNLSKISIQELCLFKGIDKIKAMKILASLLLAKRMQKELMTKLLFNTNYNSLIIYSYCIHLFLNSITERLFILYFDKKNNLINEKLISIGNDIEIKFKINDIFECQSNDIKNIILVHNHLRDDFLPSNNDILSTISIEKEAKKRNITLLDHIIIYKDKYFSFYDNKILTTN